jgi:hypothetical protein
MLHEILRKILPQNLPENLPRDLPIDRCAGRSRRWAVAEGSAPSYGVRDYSRREPQGSIVEKRRLRLASCDEALFIITTSPLDCPTASARPLPHPAERRLVVPTATLANRRHMWASFAKAVRCYRLYGDITFKFTPDKNCLARERAVGNEAMKNRSVIPNLTLSGTRELFRRARRARGPRV